MTREPPNAPGEQPRSEPEIIPPRRGRSEGGVIWTSIGERSAYRIYAARLGPLSIAILLIGIALVATLLIILLIGTFLIWIPIAALLFFAVIISAWWRRLFPR